MLQWTKNYTGCIILIDPSKYFLYIYFLYIEYFKQNLLFQEERLLVIFRDV